MKIHIGKNGPAPCNARSRSCPIGGEHFEGDNALEDARKFYERKYSFNGYKSKLNAKSKKLAYILRHNPGSIGASMTDNGFVKVTDVLEGLDVSFQDLKKIVHEDDKGRYEFSGSGKEIRARQGHSVKVDLGLEEVTPPEFLYHGTSANAYSSIKKSGLKPMARHAVHLSESLDTARRVAERRKSSDTVILKIHSGRMGEDGYHFTMSANRVFLVNEVPARYIEKI